jgi:probable rRNA maturation factor
MKQFSIQIDVQLEDATVGDVDVGPLKRAALAALEAGGVRPPAELAIVITTDECIRELNRTYRNVDAPTDVLAFGEAHEGHFVTAPGAPRYLGDVIVSVQRAAEQAQRAGHDTESELQLLIVHGVLHLLGYDHAEKQDKDRMWSAQASVLKDLQVLVANPTPEEVD